MGAGVNPPPEGSLPVPILTDDHAVLADLGVPVLLGQGEAEVPCPVSIGGIVLPGGGGADHIKAGHLVSVRLVCFILVPMGADSGAACATPSTVTPPNHRRGSAPIPPAPGRQCRCTPHRSG